MMTRRIMTGITFRHIKNESFMTLLPLENVCHFHKNVRNLREEKIRSNIIFSS